MSYGDINKGSVTQQKDSLGFLAGEYDHEIMLGKIVDDGIDGFEFHQALPLTKLFSYIIYSQSIFKPHVTVDIGISQAKRITEQFGTKGLQGEEFVKLNFGTPKTDKMDKVSDLFYVAGYTPFRRDQHDMKEGTNISCVSKEKLVNDLVSVNQAYEKTMTESASSIYNHYILQNIQYKKLMALNKDGNNFWETRGLFTEDPSVGVQKFIIPGLTPFGAMNFLATRAYGGFEYPGSLWCFYQDNHGYNFTNLEQAIERDQVNPFITEYTYDPELQDLPHYHKDYYFNIITLSGMSISNTIENTGSGEYANIVRSVDPLRKSFYDVSFNMKDRYKDFKRTGKHFQLSDRFFEEFASDPTESTIIVDSFKGGEMPGFIVGKRKSYQQLMSTYSLEATVFGNTELNVGRCIRLKLREAGVTTHKPRGSMYSGLWFITDLQHILSKDRFVTKLTLVKDSPEFLHVDKPEAASLR